MDLFKVYPLYDIEIERGSGSYIWDAEGNKYLDLYGGHAVIAIGHSHPHYIDRVTSQLKKLGFYSNSVENPLQEELAKKLGEMCGHPSYNLFLCNSGAEANENALKLASFHTGRKKIISFTQGFHGRTSLAVAVTDNPAIVAPVNQTENAIILPFDDLDMLEHAFRENEIAAVIIEGIQGIGGVRMPEKRFIKKIRQLCDEHDALYIADAVQCGMGRSGRFFSHDYFEIDADIYTMAKGLGNGFPIAGLIIHPRIEAKYGMLGTTFGGNHLACAAALATLEVIDRDNLIENAFKLGDYLKNEISKMYGVLEVRGKGLMIGIELDIEATPIRRSLLFEHKIFTGAASNKRVMRILPPLNVTRDEIDVFIKAFKKVLDAQPTQV